MNLVYVHLIFHFKNRYSGRETYKSFTRNIRNKFVPKNRCFSFENVEKLLQESNQASEQRTEVYTLTRIRNLGGSSKIFPKFYWRASRNVWEKFPNPVKEYKKSIC